MKSAKAQDATTSVRQELPPGTATQRLRVGLTQGLHLRVCSAIATAVGRHRAEVCIRKGSQCADATSILDLLLLDAPQDTELVVVAKGADAQEALHAVAELLARDFLDRC